MLQQQRMLQGSRAQAPHQRCAGVSSRPAAAARPRQLTPRVRAEAAADLGQSSSSTSSGGSCPFLSATSSPSAAAAFPDGASTLQPPSAGAAVPAELASLHGPGWRVLPGGNPPEQQLPEPEGRWAWNPLLGEYGEMERKGMGPFLVERYQQFGPVFSWKLGPNKVVAVLDYDIIKSLLKQGESKVIVGWNPEAMYAMLGEGARASLEVPSNRMHNRKHMAPAFSREALRSYLGTLVDICHNQLEAWASAPGPVDLAAEGKDLSFEFSTQLLVDFQIPPERKAELRAKFAQLFQGMVAPPIRLPGTRFSRGLQARAELIEEIKGLMAHRQAGPRKSVLDYTLESRTQLHGDLTADQKAEGGMGLIIAGNDTSGLGVTALLAVLPMFPQVLDKLRQEQEQLVAQHGPELSVSLLDRMVYAEAVVKEVLRVAPPSGLVMRKTLVDMEMRGKFVPAGSLLHMSTFLAQVLTDPRLNLRGASEQELQALYDNWALITQHTLSADFNPDRWLQPEPAPGPGYEPATPSTQAAAEAALGLSDPDSSSPAAATGGCPFSSGSSSSSGEALAKPSGLLTFSAGPHACLGYSLFMAEAKVLLALLARGYSAQPVHQESLNFKAKFLTLLQHGTVKFSRAQQPLPYSAKAHEPRTVAADAGAAGDADAHAADAASTEGRKEAVAV